MTSGAPYRPAWQHRAHKASRQGPSFVQAWITWYPACALGLAMAVIYTNLAIYCYVLNPGLLPKFFFLAMYACFLPILLSKYRLLVDYACSPFFAWGLAFLILNALHLMAFSTMSDVGGGAFVDSLTDARQTLVSIRTQYVLFAMCLGFVAFTVAGQHYIGVVAMLMVLVPGAILVDFLYPGLLYRLDVDGAVLGRAAAMFINPTMAGEAVLLIFLLGCARVGARYRTPLFFLAGAAIVSTFSRSSMIAWVFLLVILVAKKALPKSALLVSAIVAAIVLISLGSFEHYLQARQDFESASSNILSRLNFFSTLKFDDDSSEERAQVIRQAWALFLQNPLFGAGAGATHFWSFRASTHNQLLFFAAEYGIPGIGLWVWMIVIVWKGKFFRERGLQMAMAFLFFFMSFFTHQMLDSATYWLTTLALTAVRDRKAAQP